MEYDTNARPITHSLCVCVSRTQWGTPPPKPPRTGTLRPETPSSPLHTRVNGVEPPLELIVDVRRGLWAVLFQRETHTHTHTHAHTHGADPALAGAQGRRLCRPRPQTGVNAPFTHTRGAKPARPRAFHPRKMGSQDRPRCEARAREARAWGAARAPPECAAPPRGPPAGAAPKQPRKSGS